MGSLGGRRSEIAGGNAVDAELKCPEALLTTADGTDKWCLP